MAPSPTPRPADRSPRAWWRSLPRGRRTALLLVGVVSFLAISGLLARYLSVENAERDDILAVLEAQARGDAARELALLPGCRAQPSCAATVRTSANKLRRTGAVKILSVKSPTAYSLTGTTGTTRVAWTTIGKLPVVQCVRVRRAGDFLRGIHVSLLSLSAPIAGEADC